MLMTVITSAALRYCDQHLMFCRLLSTIVVYFTVKCFCVNHHEIAKTAMPYARLRLSAIAAVACCDINSNGISVG